MAKPRNRDEDDRAQQPNPQGSVYEESGYPEEHSARHGVGQRDDDSAAAAKLAPPADNATSGSSSGQEAGYRQREEQQAYRRSGAN
jgi:hypothetical protein